MQCCGTRPRNKDDAKSSGGARLWKSLSIAVPDSAQVANNASSGKGRKTAEMPVAHEAFCRLVSCQIGLPRARQFQRF